MEKFNKFETRLAYLSSYLQMWVNNIIYSPLIICDMDYKLISENQERNIKSVKVFRKLKKNGAMNLYLNKCYKMIFESMGNRFNKV